jgi:hypothetical protein
MYLFNVKNYTKTLCFQQHSTFFINIYVCVLDTIINIIKTKNFKKNNEKLK